MFNFILLIEINLISNQKNPPKSDLNFSIIIAAKNEEENLPALINSLNGLNYPKEKFEIVMVDDNSNPTILSILQKNLQLILKILPFIK